MFFVSSESLVASINTVDCNRLGKSFCYYSKNRENWPANKVLEPVPGTIQTELADSLTSDLYEGMDEHQYIPLKCR
jgi:hypothetical protein